MSNPFEERARLAKAVKLADTLAGLSRTADDVVRMTAYQWGLAADAAGVSPPSETTKAQVYDLLRQRAAAVAAGTRSNV